MFGNKIVYYYLIFGLKEINEYLEMNKIVLYQYFVKFKICLF